MYPSMTPFFCCVLVNILPTKTLPGDAGQRSTSFSYWRMVGYAKIVVIHTNHTLLTLKLTSNFI